MFSSSPSPFLSSEKGKQGLACREWLTGWSHLIYEFLFQRIATRNLQTCLPLPPLDGVTCIVTGCTSGIGIEIARQLAESGAHVVMAVRNQAAAHDLIKKWQNEWSGTGPLNIEVMEVNLLSLHSVAKFAKAWNASSRPLHLLINNAGIFSIGEPQRFSKDGYETHLQVNHLAPSLLSVLLLPSLIKGYPSRIINMNSTMHYIGFVDASDMNFASGKREFTSKKAYSSSKLAQLMFSSILHKRLPADAEISVICVSPGIVRTNVARDLPKSVQIAYHLLPTNFTPQEGARSTVFAATDPQILHYCRRLKADERPVCAYISYDCHPESPSREAHDLKTAHEVWERTMDFIGLPSDAVEKLLRDEMVECRFESQGD